MSAMSPLCAAKRPSVREQEWRRAGREAAKFVIPEKRAAGSLQIPLPVFYGNLAGQGSSTCGSLTPGPTGF